MRDHKDYLRQDPDERDIHDKTEIPQDFFTHATEKQLNYIEILKNDLGMSIHTRDAHITSIVGNQWVKRCMGSRPDVWALSRSEASQVIDKFRQWKEEKR